MKLELQAEIQAASVEEEMYFLVNARHKPEFRSQQVFSLKRNKWKAATQESEPEVAIKSTLDPLAQRVVKLPQVNAMDNLPNLKSSLESATDLGNLLHLKDLRLHGNHGSGITLLIGWDVPSALIPHVVRQGREDEPHAKKIELGWTINGPFGDSLEMHKLSAISFKWMLDYI